jgi:hypothetical protein
MDATHQAEKGDVDPKHLEFVQDDLARAQPVHYRPQNDEEKKLDKKVNFKLDLFVLTVLALEFIFCGIDKTNIGDYDPRQHKEKNHLY